MIDLIVKGIEHEGFSLINIFSPCITFNKTNTYQWYRENIEDISDNLDYDPSNAQMAMKKLMDTEGLCTGLIYQNKDKNERNTVFDFAPEALVNKDLNLPKGEFDKLMKDFT